MAYAYEIGLRYLRSKKRSTISIITGIAVTGVALGVAALLTVLSITGGFQKQFQDKVLGVNAHVLVLRYGLDFRSYREVLESLYERPDVAGAGPFLINEMMLAKGDRIGSVLVKGVDPVQMTEVLDVNEQLVAGSLEGLRVPGATPPQSVERGGEGGNELDTLLRDLRDRERGGEEGRDSDTESDELSPPDETLIPEQDPEVSALPVVDVPSPEEVEQALGAWDDLDELPDLPDDLSEDRLMGTLEEDDPTAEGDSVLPGIVVGCALAENLGLEIGDQVKVISPLTGIDTSMFSGGSRSPRSRDFRVIAIFEAGFHEYDSRLVYTDLYEAQTFYDNGDAVTGVEIRLHDLDEAFQVAAQLEQELGSPFHTMDWATLNLNLFTALRIQKVVLSLVIATIIFVAAFNVIATLILIVIEKKREIAILKAMGASDRTVLGIFLVQGSIIGVVGTAIGLLVGGAIVLALDRVHYPLDPKVYLIDHLPVVISASEFVITSAVALFICVFATLVPSWWAARMLPADGVRHE